jgi:YesN/AraC family two-component response regulator
MEACDVERTNGSSRAAPAITARHVSQNVRTLLCRIRRDYDQPLTLRSVASDLGRQAEYLGSLFRQETGTTFHERLTLVRMRHAARRIRCGEKVDAVVLLVGYRSKKNFFEQFRRRFHTTPGRYRAEFRTGRVPASATSGSSSAPSVGPFSTAVG